VIGYGVLDDFEEFLLGGGGANGHAVKELDHETCESFEGSRDAHGWVDFDQDAFSGMNEDLKFAGFVDWRVKEGEEALWSSLEMDEYVTGQPYLMSNVRPCFTDVSSHLPHNADMLVTIQQRVLLLSSRPSNRSVCGSKRFQTCIGKNND